MKTISKVLWISTLSLILSVSLVANGLNLNSIGSKSSAMGTAFIGLADDFSAVFFNPAGLVQMKEASLTLFGTALFPSGTYQFDMAGIDTETESAMYPSGALAYFKQGLERNSDNIRCLLGFFASNIALKNYNDAYKAGLDILQEFPTSPRHIPNFIRTSIATENYQDIPCFYDIIQENNIEDETLKKYIAAGLVLTAKHFLDKKKGSGN